MLMSQTVQIANLGEVNSNDLSDELPQLDASDRTTIFNAGGIKSSFSIKWIVGMGAITAILVIAVFIAGPRFPPPDRTSTRPL
jgi:hypothetical protein